MSIFKESQKNIFLPVLILVFCVSIAIITTYFIHVKNIKVQQQELELKAHDVKFNIQSRLNAYQQFSKSSASFFMSSDTITREEWRFFIENSKVSKNLKGFQGVSFITIVSNVQLEKHTQRFKKEFATNYTIFPSSQENIYTPIIFIEPLKDRNIKAIGFNISSNFAMRKALEESRDFNEATLTDKVTLIQDEDSVGQAGSVIYTPIYNREMLFNTINERRNAIIGWTAISFRINDFMKDLIAQFNNDKSIIVNLYEDNFSTNGALIFSSTNAKTNHIEKKSLSTFYLPIELNKKVWTLEITQPSINFLESISFIILIFGLLISVLLSFLVYSYKNTALIANRLAQKLTNDLNNNNKELINRNTLLNESYIRLELAKEKAESNELQLKLITNNFLNGMIYQVAMLDENKRKFNYVSDTVLNLYGCTSKEAMQNPDLIYGKIHPEDIGMLIEEEKKALENMSTFNVEARTFNPDGSIRWSYYISQPRLINGIVCWDGIEIDISYRKKMELELLQAKNKAEESDRLKTAFLANMSHEIRTPMNTIIGFSELLMDDELSIDKKSKYHEILNNSGKRLMNLINDIVDISRIDANQLNLSYSIFNLNILINNLQSQFEITSSRKNVSIQTSKAVSDENSFINCDNTRLVQVFSNLIENALKYTDEGIVEIGYSYNEKEIQCYVKDTGVGISKADQQLIFERFGQSNNQYHKAIEGTGLGLSISKGIVESFGGKIWVVSEPNNGATFYFTIPQCFLDPPEKIQPEKIVVELKTNNTPTILIAEDEKSNFLYLEAVLDDYNFNILHAVNGKEALDLFEKNQIDLILMDFNMPVMSGVEATEHIRKLNKEIPIIALTAYAMSEDREKALSVGCNLFLSKPVKRDDLINVINQFFV